MTQAQRERRLDELEALNRKCVRVMAWMDSPTDGNTTLLITLLAIVVVMMILGGGK